MDDNDDDFNERPKVKPAAIGGNNNNKPKQKALDLNELFSQNSISEMANDSQSKKVMDNPWDDTMSNEASIQGSTPAKWQKFLINPEANIAHICCGNCVSEANATYWFSILTSFILFIFLSSLKDSTQLAALKTARDTAIFFVFAFF